MSYDYKVPERLSLGELVTWGDGYATGIIIGCYSWEFTGGNDDGDPGIKVIKHEGHDPLQAKPANFFDEPLGYLILVNGATGGPGMYKCLPFDTEDSMMLNHGHANVRLAYEIK